MVSEFERFWNSLADNAVLLMVVMPLVGSGLVRLMRPSGSEPVYFTGLVNVWLTMGLALIVVARFEPGQQDESEFATHTTSSLSWFAEWQPSLSIDASSSGSDEAIRKADLKWHPIGPDVRLSVGVNRYSLWFMLLTVATTLVVFRSISPQDTRLVSTLSWLLLTESAMLGAFAAQDLILLAMCCQVSTLGLFLLIGQGGNFLRREAARRFFRTQTVSGMLILAGLVGVSISHWWMLATTRPEEANLTFSLRRIVSGLPRLAFETDAAHDLWLAVSPWLFVALCGGLMLRLPLPPFHHWWYRVCERSDSRLIALMVVGYVTLPFYMMVRVVVPLFPQLMTEMAPRLFLWTLLTSVGLAVSIVVIENLRRRLAAIGIVSSTVAFGAVILGELSGRQGGLLLTVSSGGSLALLYLSGFVARTETSSASGRATTANDVVKRAVVLLALAGLAAVPLSGSFWGGIMILDSVFRRDSTAAFWLIIAALLVALSLRKCCEFRMAESGADDDWPDVEPSAGINHALHLMPVVVILVAAAVFPQWIIGSSQSGATGNARADSESIMETDISTGEKAASDRKSLARSSPNAK